MTPLTLILLILMGITLFVWGFTEGQQRPTRSAQHLLEQRVIAGVREEGEKQVKIIGQTIAANKKEEIYLRYIFCLYVQDQIKQLPDFKDTDEDALKYATRIVTDFYKAHRQEFDDNFKENIDQVSMEVFNDTTEDGNNKAN